MVDSCRSCSQITAACGPRHPGCVSVARPLSIPHRPVQRTHDAGAWPARKETDMRVMVIVKASDDSEAGAMPGAALLRAMGAFNEQLVQAGVMLAGDGLHPSRRGKRVRFAGAERTVIDGPFAQTNELVAGFWLWQVSSMEEAVQWLKRAPFDGGTEVEIRPVFEPEDFGADMPADVQAQETRLAAEIARQAMQRGRH
jgi:hypothetical protein